MMKPALILTLLLSLFAFSFLSAQTQFTPYDDLPGICKSYKPVYSDALPGWAKKMYSCPLNFNELSREFDAWIKLRPDEESPEVRYYRIWSRAIESCVLEDGSIQLPDLSLYNRNMAEARALSRQFPNRQSQSAASWSFVGPKETFWLNETGSPTAPTACPWQANVYSFDVAASDNNILYCGTETGYVNKTTDKGLSWQQVGRDYPFGGGVTATVIDPGNPLRVFVAAGNQVHRTTDGGLTWTALLASPDLFYADRMKMDASNPQKLFAASASGLFVTTDGGSSWTKKWISPVWDVEIAPNDPNRIYAITRASGKFSVIQSTDGGLTFTAQSSFPNTIPESSGGLLAMTPANPNLMLAVMLSTNNKPYLLKGTYSGSAWTWVLLATGGTSSFPMDNGQGYFDLAMEISPVNENLILVGTTTLFKSVNAGSTFTAIGGYTGNYSIHPDIQDMRMLPSGETWVSTDGGMNLTTDNFSTQAGYSARINGLVGSDFWGFDQSWNEDLVVAGRYHNGNTAVAGNYQPKALRMGGAESPTGWVVQGKSRHVAFNDLGNGWILPETAEGEPEGRFIFSKYPNMDEYGGRRGNLVTHPYIYNTMYTGEENGFWRSEDGGVSWDLLHGFLGRVRYFQISYSKPEVIYADIVGTGLCRSGDGGVTWIPKPSLTTAPYGNTNWKGKLFLAVSPFDENVVYACLQNGTWSADLGKVFRSADGGATWQDWTGSLDAYMKCMVIQPSATGEDLVYLFTNATNGKSARVYYRTMSAPDWTEYSDGYPAGLTVNMALPFFRDGKLRVGGNSGVWECPLADTAFAPMVTPWAEKSHVNCMTDTLTFEDHSILHYPGASWHWDISPAPAWIDNPDKRNPRMVPGSAATYDVSLSVTRSGHTYTRSMPALFTATECPSIYNCSNPAEIPKDLWKLIYVDSEETNYPGLAVMSFDGDAETIWHTRWSTGNDPYPHEMQIDLGDRYHLSKFEYLTRQDGENGRIKAYELYISDDSLNWGEPVATGNFVNTSAPQTVVFDSLETGRFMRIVALSEVNGNDWASAAEFSLTGCVDSPTGIRPGEMVSNVPAFPVPTGGKVEVPLPGDGDYHFVVRSLSGAVLMKGNTGSGGGNYSFDLSPFSPGVYLIELSSADGTLYRVKVVRQ
jgi:photosystem II stability/assembly factor-like uncharacterized protein